MTNILRLGATEIILYNIPKRMNKSSQVISYRRRKTQYQNTQLRLKNLIRQQSCVMECKFRRKLKKNQALIKTNKPSMTQHYILNILS